MSKAILDGTFGVSFGTTSRPSSQEGHSVNHLSPLTSLRPLVPPESRRSIDSGIGFMSPERLDSWGSSQSTNGHHATAQEQQETFKSPTPIEPTAEELQWTVQKKLKNSKLVSRTICIDLHDATLLNFSPDGELLNSLPLSTIINLSSSPDRLTLTITFDIPGQSKYKLVFATADELKHFSCTASPFLVRPRVPVGAAGNLNPRYSHQIWREWRENIRRDKAMIRRSDPRLKTRLALIMQKLTDVEPDPNSSSQHEARHASKYAMHPKSALALLIATMSILFLVYTALVTPFSLAFFWDVNPCTGSPVAEGDMVVDLFFMLEIFITCFTGRHVKGAYVSDIQGIFVDYVSCGQLFFDLLTSIPISWIEFDQRLKCTLDENGTYVLRETGSSYQAVRALKILKPLRLLRLLRMLKLFNHRIFKIMQERIGVRPDFVRLFKLAFGVVIVAHFAGCLFWSVKVQSNDPLELRDWMFRQHFQGEDWCPYGRTTKRLESGLDRCEALGIWSAYTICFYFAMTTLTTVGFGDIYGENDLERIYCVVLQLAGTVVFATIMSQLSSVLANLTSKSRAQEDKLELVRRFCSDHNVNHAMTRKCLEWIQFQDAVQNEEQERLDVLESLPPGLQAQLALMLHSTELHAIPMLHRTGSDFLAQVAMRLGVELKSEGESVVQYGEWSDSLYIVVHGTLQVQDSQSNVLTVLGPGDFVGETQVLRPWRSEVTVVSVGFAQLKTLRHKDLCRLARKYPEVNRHFRSLSKRPASGVSISGSNFIARRHEAAAEEDDEPDGAVGKVVLRWLLLVSRSLCTYYAKDESNRLVNLLVQFSRHVAENTKLEYTAEDNGEGAAKVEWSTTDGSEDENDFYDEQPGGELDDVHGAPPRTESLSRGNDSSLHPSLRMGGSFRRGASSTFSKSFRRAASSAPEGKRSHEQAKLEARMGKLEAQNAELQQQVANVQRGVDHVVFMLARQRLEAMKSATNTASTPATNLQSTSNTTGNPNGFPHCAYGAQPSSAKTEVSRGLNTAAAVEREEAPKKTNPSRPDLGQQLDRRIERLQQAGSHLIPSMTALLTPSPRPSSVEVAEDYATSPAGSPRGDVTGLPAAPLQISTPGGSRQKHRPPLLSTISGLERSSNRIARQRTGHRSHREHDPARPAEGHGRRGSAVRAGVSSDHQSCGPGTPLGAAPPQVVQHVVAAVRPGLVVVPGGALGALEQGPDGADSNPSGARTSPAGAPAAGRTEGNGKQGGQEASALTFRPRQSGRRRSTEAAIRVSQGLAEIEVGAVPASWEPGVQGNGSVALGWTGPGGRVTTSSASGTPHGTTQHRGQLALPEFKFADAVGERYA